MKLTEIQIKEIADYLDSGMRCFYHINTSEIEFIPDFQELGVIWENEEPWKDILNKLDENFDDYFEFEKITSHDSFEIMADFAETVDNLTLKDRLFNALNKPKPFRNFKWEIDNSEEYRQKWFDYKNQRIIAICKETN
jgi:hypothetical protein